MLSRFGSRTRLSRLMMSIGKLSAGQEGYYLAGVAHGVEDYYLEAGEVPGRWLGTGAATLGLAGDVDDDEFRAVLSGEDPSAGVRLRRANARLCAFDLTLSAPKSVSLLWALGDPDTAAAVVAAQEESRSIRRSDIWSGRRCGRGVGTTASRRSTGGGVIGAAFRHRTSRAGDPQLHTHVLVANTTLCEDGVWRALDGRLLYGHARTAGFLYQAALRGRRSTRSLGASWEYPVHGQARDRRVGGDVRREFSRRRIEIEAAAAEMGNDSVRSRRAARDQDPHRRRTTASTSNGSAPTWRRRADLHGLFATAVAKSSAPINRLYQRLHQHLHRSSVPDSPRMRHGRPWTSTTVARTPHEHRGRHLRPPRRRADGRTPLPVRRDDHRHRGPRRPVPGERSGAGGRRCV